MKKHLLLPEPDISPAPVVKLSELAEYPQPLLEKYTLPSNPNSEISRRQDIRPRC